MKIFFTFLVAILLAAGCVPPVVFRSLTPAPDPAATIQSGPMLGYVDMMEAMIWVQTTGPAVVSVQYWEQDKTARFETAQMLTEQKNGYTAHLVANQVEPGKTYDYAVYVNNRLVERPYPTTFKTQPLWRWRTDPPAFSLVTGSCAYINEPEYDRPGTPYGSEYQVFTSIHQQKPDLMLWLGDNIYYREPDWATRTGMLHRNTHGRSLPELQPLLASTSHYAIWDDHDFGPNDADGTWVHKEMAWEVFQDFWGNPTYGVNGQKGCTSWFQYADVDFFLLDDRYFRSPNDCESCPRTMLGAAQIAWFKGALAQSTAPFKIVAVGGQFMSSSENGESFTHLFRAERDSILAFIERENIKGVVFLTGDKHFTELSALKNARGNMVYDLTASPFTSGVFTDAATKEINTFRVEGTVVAKHNFAMLRFSGPRKERQLQITDYDADGKEMWTKTIKAN